MSVGKLESSESKVKPVIEVLQLNDYHRFRRPPCRRLHLRCFDKSRYTYREILGSNVEGVWAGAGLNSVPVAEGVADELGLCGESDEEHAPAHTMTPAARAATNSRRIITAPSAL